MNKGLVYLWKRQQLAPIRKARKHLRGFKGALIVFGVLAFLVMIIGPQFIASATTSVESRVSELALDFGPHILLLFTGFVSLAIGGLYFTPSEITYLFPAPIPRYQLLLFNVMSRMSTQILSGAFTAIFVLAWCPTWYGAVAGAMLVMLFFQLTSQCAGLFFATLGARFSGFLHRFGTVLILAVVGGSIALMRQLGATAQDQGWLETVRAWQRLPVIDELSWLTRPFIETMFASGIRDFALWGGLAVSVLVVELLLMMWLDVAFMERALANSQRLQKRLERMRSGGGAMAASGPGKAHFSLPPLPSLWGAGPIVWRQLTEMIRHPRPLFATVLIMGAWMIPVFYLPSTDDDGSLLPAMAIVGIVFMSTMITVQLNFDFRRDIDRMAYLKSLPIGASSMAAGQILPNCLLVCILQLLAIVVVILVAPVPALHVVAAAPCILLVNWISVALDNSVFLLFPYRMAPKDPGQFQFMGRLALAMFAKMMAFMMLLGACAAPAFGVYEFTDSMLAAAGAAALVLFVAAAGCTWMCGQSFVRFDPGREVP